MFGKVSKEGACYIKLLLHGVCIWLILWLAIFAASKHFEIVHTYKQDLTNFLVGFYHMWFYICLVYIVKMHDLWQKAYDQKQIGYSDYYVPPFYMLPIIYWALFINRIHLIIKFDLYSYSYGFDAGVFFIVAVNFTYFFLRALIRAKKANLYLNYNDYYMKYKYHKKEKQFVGKVYRENGEGCIFFKEKSVESLVMAFTKYCDDHDNLEEKVIGKWKPIYPENRRHIVNNIQKI